MGFPKPDSHIQQVFLPLLLANVARPIISFDFLCAHKLDMSPAAGLVRFATSTLEEPPRITATAARPLAKVSPSVHNAIPADVHALLAEFQAILRGNSGPPAPKQGYASHQSTGRPIFSLAGRLYSKKLALAKAEF